MRLLILLFPAIVVFSTKASNIGIEERVLMNNGQSLRDTFVKWSFKRPSAVVRDLEIGLEKLKSLGFSETIHKGGQSRMEGSSESSKQPRVWPIDSTGQREVFHPEIKDDPILESKRVLGLQIIPELTRLESKSARNGSLPEVADLKTEIKKFFEKPIFDITFKDGNHRIRVSNEAKVTIFEITGKIASLIAKVKDMYGLRK
jgi:hypothetical protein